MPPGLEHDAVDKEREREPVGDLEILLQYSDSPPEDRARSISGEFFQLFPQGGPPHSRKLEEKRIREREKWRAKNGRQRDVIVGVQKKFEEREEIEDLLCLVEAYSPRENKGDARFGEGLFHFLKPGAAPEQDRDVAVTRPPRGLLPALIDGGAIRHQPGDLSGDHTALELRSSHPGLPHINRGYEEKFDLSIRAIGSPPDQLMVADLESRRAFLHRPGKDAVDKIHGAGEESEAFREGDGWLRFGSRSGFDRLPRFLEDLHFRVAETENGLLRVAHDEQVARREVRNQQPDDLILEVIGILVFVDHDELQLRGELSADLFALEQIAGLHQEVVEIEEAKLLLSPAVECYRFPVHIQKDPDAFQENSLAPAGPVNKALARPFARSFHRPVRGLIPKESREGLAVAGKGGDILFRCLLMIEAIGSPALSELSVRRQDRIRQLPVPAQFFIRPHLIGPAGKDLLDIAPFSLSRMREQPPERLAPGYFIDEGGRLLLHQSRPTPEYLLVGQVF